MTDQFKTACSKDDILLSTCTWARLLARAPIVTAVMKTSTAIVIVLLYISMIFRFVIQPTPG